MRYQPQGLQRLNPSNPFVKDLLVAVLPGSTVNLVDGAPITQSGTAAVAGRPVGLTISNGALELPAPASASDPWAKYDIQTLTALTVVVQNAKSAVAPAFYRGNGSATPTWAVGLHGGASANGLYAAVGSLVLSASSLGTNISVTDVSRVIVLTADGSNAKAYVDGVLNGSGAYTPSTPQYDPSNARRVRFGAINGTNGQTQNRPSLGLLFKRALTAGEVAALSANPWQVFADPYEDDEPVSVAQTGNTATLAWTEADDVASITDVITDSATEGWAEADDAHAIAAAVVNRAAASWTEGDDVHAAVSVVSDSDALWWIEADDVIALAGTVATQQPVNVAGSLGWTEQDDAFAAFMAAATNGAPGYGSSKPARKYVVRRGEQLYTFSDPEVAKAFLQADDDPPAKRYPTKKQVKQVPAAPMQPKPAPVPEQRVDLAEIRALAARQHAEAEYQQLMAQKRYEALLVLLERLREEEEDDWLLMAAE
ncbi:MULTISPECIES: hypothetical protein [unclassified Massilia]|uniref:hypothetical protein n=1 Tax=unclassified Massilia TaxID=2609279 RepID=UPI0012E16FC2|nr:MULTISPECIES: hypothetical protein [unclassified Massilia]